MKVTIKRKAEAQERITFRLSASLKKRMDETRALADSVAADYYASMVDIIDAGDQALREKLIQAGAKVGDNSGDKIRTSNGADPDRT